MVSLQRELWTDEDWHVFELFNFKCIRCLQPAVTLHEISPKSLNLNWNTPENKVPICAKCHSWAHERGTNYSADILIALRKKRLNV